MRSRSRYHSESTRIRTGAEEFLDALELFRLHLAVQWLGWDPGWSPPDEHRHDWLAEALSAADKLGL